jgi:hypothetical protein|tara:strand:+ start:1928 stop:2371 length:444 start_codon:yes stop_codon:yes gene_type:complete
MAIIGHKIEKRDITKIASAGTLFQPMSNCYVLTVKNASNVAIDLRGEDDATLAPGSYAVAKGGPNTSIVETVEAIVQELNPLAYFTVDGASGVMHLVLDKSETSASELQTRVRRIGKDSGANTTSIGPNDIDISGSTVTAGSSITVA